MFGKREQEPSMLNMNDDHLRHVEKDIVIPKMYAPNGCLPVLVCARVFFAQTCVWQW